MTGKKRMTVEDISTSWVLHYIFMYSLFHLQEFKISTYWIHDFTISIWTWLKYLLGWVIPWQFFTETSSNSKWPRPSVKCVPIKIVHIFLMELLCFSRCACTHL
jgi:hypothetical protein